MKKGAFTLVELIVVITILAVLGTIGFISFSGYLVGARDTNRTSQLKAMSDALEVYAVTKPLPIPDDKIDLKSDGTIIAYQGYLGANVLNTVEYSGKGLDPKDKTYFSYYLTKDKKYFQLMAFLEEPSEDAVAGIFDSTQAVDYTDRYPTVTGKKIGILTDENNTPIQEIVTGELEMSGSTVEYIANFQDSDTLQLSANNLRYVLITNSDEIYKAPTDCADGFIGAPGNAQFSQKGFCVAQYEMTYGDADTPNSCNIQYPTACTIAEDWNTVRYEPGKKIVSQAGKYPIANIKQEEAITACQSMGTGYHLITNNEWMTIGRNIEQQKSNWSSGTVGTGNIYNGVSNETSLGCNAKGGNTESRAYATKTGAGTDTTCNTRRSHALSNGLTIWDISGNVYEHVNKANTLDGSGFNTGQTTVAGATSGISWDDDGIYAQIDMPKYASLYQLGKASGMGNLYYSHGVANNIFLRGGDAGSGSDAGLFSLFLTWSASTQSRGAGFRCVK